MNQLAGTQLFSAFDDSGYVKHGLPSVAYTENDFYELEAGQIFSKNWTFVGFAHDLSDVGDVMPIRVAKQSLFLVRSEKDKIRAFHNVCLHRNLKLVDKSHNCKNLITCPYHNWCYDLDGKLRATPFFGGGKTELPEGFSLEDHGLHEVTCRLFHDWLFVNLSSESPSFDSHIAPLRKQLADFNLNEFFVVASIEFGEIKTNWKLLMENFIEPYHVQFVHKNTTNQPLVDHYVVSEGHCLGSAVDLKQDQIKEGILSVSSRYLTLLIDHAKEELFHYFHLQEIDITKDFIQTTLNIPNKVLSIKDLLKKLFRFGFVKTFFRYKQQYRIRKIKDWRKKWKI